MSVKQGQVSVGTTATLLDQAMSGVDKVAMLVRNRGTGVVYLGGADVSSANGLQLDVGDAVTLEAETYSVGLYGRAASGTQAVHVLQVGV